MTTTSEPQDSASLEAMREFLALAKQIEEWIGPFDSIQLLNELNILAYAAGISEEAHERTPDGFGQKFRYIQNVLAKRPLHLGFQGQKDEMAELFSLVDRLFDLISQSWMTKANHLTRQRPEQKSSIEAWFMSRMRDLYELPLGGTSQHRRLLLDRFTHFDPSIMSAFGFTTAQCVTLLDSVGSLCLSGLTTFSTFDQEACEDFAKLDERIERGELTFNQAAASGQESAAAIKAREAWRGLFTVTAEQIAEHSNLPVANVVKFLGRASVQPGGFESAYILPIDKPHGALFFRREDGSFYVIDICSLHQDFFALAKSAVTSAGDKSAEKYYKWRGKVTPKNVAASLANVFGAGSIVENLYYSPTGRPEDFAEADILVQHGDAILLCEVKGRELNRDISDPVGPERMASDFKAIQEGYAQCRRTGTFIKRHDPARFYRSDRSTPLLELRGAVREFHYLVVTANSFGPLAGNCSELLQRDPEDPLPVVMSEFELSTMLDQINTPESLLKYLRQRVLLHGFLKTGDELEPAGVFVTQGSLDDLIAQKMSGNVDLLILGPDVSFVFNGPNWERKPEKQEAIQDKRLTMTPITAETVRSTREGPSPTPPSRRVRRMRK